MDWKEEDTKILLEEMGRMYPAPECALEFGSLFQLLIAVILSAQTTDKQVNVVTKDLFRIYPDAASLAEADPSEVEQVIRRRKNLPRPVLLTYGFVQLCVVWFGKLRFERFEPVIADCCHLFLPFSRRYGEPAYYIRNLPVDHRTVP